MKDTELRARLIKLGMPAPRANDMTRQIRDRLLPVAAVAAYKVAQQRQAQGMSGYDDEQLAGLLKKIKKVAKGAVKVVKKVALPVAAIVAAPVTGGASVAAYGAIKGAQIAKSAQKSANVSAEKQTAMVLAAQPAVAADANLVAAEAVQGNYPADPTQLLMSMLANQGSNMVSPPAQQLMQDVASQGVQQTAAGPSPLPAWVIPAGIGVAGLLGVLMLTRGRR